MYVKDEWKVIMNDSGVAPHQLRREQFPMEYVHEALEVGAEKYEKIIIA